MKLILRFALPLLLTIAIITYGVVPLVDSLTLRWFSKDVEIRSNLVLNTLHDSLIELLESQNKRKIETLFNKAIQDERLYAIALCDKNNSFYVSTNTFPPEIPCSIEEYSRQKDLHGGKTLITSKSLYNKDQYFKGQIILVHDLSFIQKRSFLTKKYIIYLFATIGIIISLIAVLIARFSIWGWTRSFRKILSGDFRSIVSDKSPQEFRPFFKDLRNLLTEIEKERRFRDESGMQWTPKTLKDILGKELLGDEVIIVSNREPYIHEMINGEVHTLSPASGVVTALEPVMKACSGTWIAHGSGNADKTHVDKHDSLLVPPLKPKYKLRRVWLSKEEEEGYYYGFSNEGLWPLCHIAHVRPIFRTQDWEQYNAVNEKFAQVVLEEAKTEDPVILIQDYHFALLPKIIKEKLPKATVIMFWHIPWPNPESFGICPWREEILKGMLGSSILGFHTPFHCHNFIDTVDRYLECRIDHSSSTISFNSKQTSVHSYPISIEPWTNPEDKTQSLITREQLLSQLGLSPQITLGIGVDRMDYTKGIIERFMAIERFFEKHPEWKKRFSFVQIAAPSRSNIEEYKRFSESVKQLSKKINARFESENWKPIILLAEHKNRDEINNFYIHSDLCIVSSLHDGMNLVAKEYISQRNDDSGVLILSQFTGAAMELPEAIIINPYDIDLCANAIAAALEMPKIEQRQRMKSLRAYINEFNVYRWAGRMLLDSARMRRRERIIRTKLS